MTDIISLELAQKLFDIIKNNVVVKLGRIDTRIFVTLSYNNNIFHKEYLERYDTIEQVESAAKVLSETFVCEYVGEIDD